MLYLEAKSIVESEMMARWPEYNGWQNPAIIGAWSKLFAKYEAAMVMEAIDTLWSESKSKTPQQGRFTEIMGGTGATAKKSPVGYTNIFVICVEQCRHVNHAGQEVGDKAGPVGDKEHIAYPSVSNIPDADRVMSDAQKIATQRALCYGGVWQVIQAERMDCLGGDGKPWPQWFVESDGEKMAVGGYCQRIRPVANKRLAKKMAAEMTIDEMREEINRPRKKVNPYIGRPAGWLEKEPSRTV